MESSILSENDLRIFEKKNPECILLQITGTHESELLAVEVEHLRKNANHSFLFTAFSVPDWNRDLSPWASPPAYGKEPFGSGADKTLSVIEELLLPKLREKYGSLPLILGGYSLAGLFALYASGKTDSFNAIAACSPSLWFPDFMEYAKSNPPKAEYVYLSLGKKEEMAKNPILRTVGDCMRSYRAMLDEKKIASSLYWNEGNHFHQPEIRTADGFSDCIRQLLG